MGGEQGLVGVGRGVFDGREGTGFEGGEGGLGSRGGILLRFSVSRSLL